MLTGGIAMHKILHNIVVRRILKIFLWIVGLFVGLSLLVGAGVAFILTPEQLTPLVERYANDYLDADVKMESIDATFFSTYPRIGIRIKNGYIVSHTFHSADSVEVSRRDTLLEFSELDAVSSLHFLLAGKIRIGQIYATDAVIRLHTDSIGRSNWQIIREKIDENQDSIANEEADTEVSLRRLWLDNAKFIYSDRHKNKFIKLGGLNLRADGNMDLKALSIDVNLTDTTTTIRIGNTRYLSRLALGLNGHLDYDIDNDYYQFKDAKLKVGVIDLDLGGWLHFDDDTMRMDLNYALSTPSAKTLFEYLPQNLISTPVDVRAGAVSLTGSLKGDYNENLSPVFSCNALIDSVNAKYEGMPYEIEDITAKVDVLADAQRPDSSFVNMDILHFKGAKTEVTAMVSVSSLLADPDVDCKVDAHIDLPTFTEIFPIANTEMRGDVDANISAHFKFSDIKEGFSDRIRAEGTLDIDSLHIENEQAGFSIAANAHVVFDGKDTLGIRSRVSDMNLQTKKLQLRVRNVRTRLKTIASRDSTILPTTTDDITIGRFYVKL